MKDTNIAKHLKYLEEQLFKPEIRKSPNAVSALLADEFIEFASSGIIYNKQQTIDKLSSESQMQISLKDFKALQLSKNIVLITYIAIISKQQNTPIQSLRSSIWKYTDNQWQIVFHQGTTIKPNNIYKS